ncbi:hypothetical protein Zmor_020158 [Zophobas morio]|uniref:Uncharacterized protein n=1 Tax=Zophobas morio TaxID=2755281 RepID=A0AA38I2R3_9CUCU|nr:hypothetical protein Zmor_020158 [Zophobas morio]
MKSFLFLLFLISCYQTIYSTRYDQKEWEKFKKTYAKTYQDQAEESYRKSIFFKNLQTIEDHNQKYTQGLVTYTVAINKFADRTVNELAKASRPTHRQKTKTKKVLISDTGVPESIDWRDYGVITPIVDQDFCLSCWAFAVVAAVEAHVGIHLNRKNQTLSEENLIDCVYPDFNCTQEMVRTALEDSYQYIVDNGIDTAESYPYDEETSQCRFKPENVGATITDYARVPEGDEEELKRVVGTIGPVSVMISVDLTFMVHRTGVYYKENCVDIKEPYNHAVTVIGYGEEDGQEYWLVRNEWGTTFSENGYIKMARNRGNLCGIATYATYPIIGEQNLV